MLSVQAGIAQTRENFLDKMYEINAYICVYIYMTYL